MAESYATQLDRVQEAIARIEAGNQSYTILGRSFTNADLQTLYDREAWLRKMVAHDARRGRFMQRAIPL